MPVSKTETHLLRGAAHVRQLDSLVSYLTPFIPGQSPSAELLSEGAAASLALLQIWQDQVVARISSEDDQSLDARFLNAEYAANRNYRVLAYVLSVVNSTELLVEMAAAHKKGARGRWRAVLSVETLKVALRLGMLALSRRQLPANVPVHELGLEADAIREILDRAIERSKGTGTTNRAAENSGSHYDGIRLSTKQLQSYNGALTTASRYSLRVPDRDRIIPPLQLLRRLDPTLLTAEVLNILRPLLYAVLLYRYRNKKKSWTPWLLGVTIELVSRQLVKKSMVNNAKRPPTQLEKDVMSSRTRDLAWWLMRGAFYEEYTRVLLQNTANALAKVPLLNLGGVLIEDWLYIFDEYYFGAATM